MNYFDQNSTLEEEISNFLFFRPQNRLKLSNYWPNVITEVSRRYLYLTLFLMGLSPGPDYRRYLHWISKTAIFVISAPLLEHSWCFLWDYRRYLYLTLFLIGLSPGPGRTRFSEPPCNSAYSSRFRLKNSKIDKNRRTIVQRNSDFWPGHGFHFKSISPTQNLMEITKMWIILIKTQHLRKKSAIFCLFDLKIGWSSVTTDLT